jgi:hypothetical protein
VSQRLPNNQSHQIAIVPLNLFVCVLPPEQFFSYPEAVTITGDGVTI